MQTQLISLAGISLRVDCPRVLPPSDKLAPFIGGEAPPVAVISVHPGEEPPAPEGELSGEDTHFLYFRRGATRWVCSRPDWRGRESAAVYAADFSRCALYLNTRDYPGALPNLDRVLNQFPVSELLLRHGAVQLHASRIAVNGRAVLFTAPSGTGKSTQAGLWARHAGAEIVSGDRSLLRMEGGQCGTYGYPLDGSAPVCDPRRFPLGAIVVLSQDSENRVERLRVAPALARLCEQTVAGPWEGAQAAAERHWLAVLERCPVYHLRCTPDKTAVDCLKQRLKKDGVF